MNKYRKKPVEILAIQLNNNIDQIKEFVGDDLKIDPVSRIAYISTLEGEMMCSHNDYIIKGVNREFYPCKPDVFEKSYERNTREEYTRGIQGTLFFSSNPPQAVSTSSTAASRTPPVTLRAR